MQPNGLQGYNWCTYKCHNSHYLITWSPLLHLWNSFYEAKPFPLMYILMILKTYQKNASKAGGPALIGVWRRGVGAAWSALCWTLQGACRVLLCRSCSAASYSWKDSCSIEAAQQCCLAVSFIKFTRRPRYYAFSPVPFTVKIPNYRNVVSVPLFLWK